MAEEAQSKILPELVFGIAGPIGVDVAAISDSLKDALRVVRYDAHTIHLTAEMMTYRLRSHTVNPPIDSNFFADVIFKIDYANALCAEFGDPATLARIGLRAIAAKRKALAQSDDKLPKSPTAYIIRQLKRPDEVAL